MQSFIMSIDQGTTSTRAILFNQQSEIIAMAQRELATYYPKPGFVEQDANEIWASTVGVMFEVLAKSGIKATQIAGIGITNQRETTVIWDKETGQPIYPAIVWQSRQSDHYCQKLKEKNYESWIKEKTGLILDPYFSASKIRFILDTTNKQQEAVEGKLCFGTIDSWLVYKLTNGASHITDVSNASRTLLMNIHTLNYDQELLDLWNIPRCILPTIKSTSEIYGVCEGIFETPIPIASVVGDQQAALFGQACFDAGDVKNTYGTGCFLLMNTKEKVITSKNGLISCVGWKINNEVNYVLEGSVFVAGAAIQWLRDGLKIIDQSSDSYNKAISVVDNDGVYIVPAFTGLGAPYWKPHVKGAMFGLTRRTKQEHIIRATLESLAYQTTDLINAMDEDAKIKISKLRVDGGACENEFLLQFQSDILNMPVERSLISETTALGAAYLAGLAVGYWSSLDEIKASFNISKTYYSTMPKDKRHEYLTNWKKAVNATMAFEE